MKNWFKSHYRVIIALLLFVVIYYAIYNFSSNYVDFRKVYPSGNLNTMEFNMKVARFYFIQLPLGAMLPAIAYLLISYFNSKSQE